MFLKLETGLEVRKMKVANRIAQNTRIIPDFEFLAAIQLKK